MIVNQKSINQISRVDLQHGRQQPTITTELQDSDLGQTDKEFGYVEYACVIDIISHYAKFNIIATTNNIHQDIAKRSKVMEKHCC